MAGHEFEGSKWLLFDNPIQVVSLVVKGLVERQDQKGHETLSHDALEQTHNLQYWQKNE